MDNYLLEFSPEDIGTLADVESESVWGSVREDQSLRDQIMQLIADRYDELSQDVEDDGESDDEEE